MKVSMSFGKEYESKYEWNCFCQGGSHGIVLPEGSINKIFESDALEGLVEGMASEETYITAFFEAFPKNPSCFLRGEGKTIEEAEEECWKKYQKVVTCDHEMERRDRTDGYGYCKKCSYSHMVFQPLTKCCKCGKPTAYSKDYKGRYYCEKHNTTKPKNPNPGLTERMTDPRNRLQRKRKKLLKKCATNKFQKENLFGKVKFSYKFSKKFFCEDYHFALLFKSQEIDFIKKYNKFHF